MEEVLAQPFFPDLSLFIAHASASADSVSLRSQHCFEELLSAGVRVQNVLSFRCLLVLIDPSSLLLVLLRQIKLQGVTWSLLSVLLLKRPGLHNFSHQHTGSCNCWSRLGLWLNLAQVYLSFTLLFLYGRRLTSYHWLLGLLFE